MELSCRSERGRVAKRDHRKRAEGNTCHEWPKVKEKLASRGFCFVCLLAATLASLSSFLHSSPFVASPLIPSFFSFFFPSSSTSIHTLLLSYLPYDTMANAGLKSMFDRRATDAAALTGRTHAVGREYGNIKKTAHRDKLCRDYGWSQD